MHNAMQNMQLNAQQPQCVEPEMVRNDFSAPATEYRMATRSATRAQMLNMAQARQEFDDEDSPME